MMSLEDCVSIEDQYLNDPEPSWASQEISLPSSEDNCEEEFANPQKDLDDAHDQELYEKNCEKSLSSSEEPSEKMDDWTWYTTHHSSGPTHLPMIHQYETREEFCAAISDLRASISKEGNDALNEPPKEKGNEEDAIARKKSRGHIYCGGNFRPMQQVKSSPFSTFGSMLVANLDDQIYLCGDDPDDEEHRYWRARWRARWKTHKMSLSSSEENCDESLSSPEEKCEEDICNFENELESDTEVQVTSTFGRVCKWIGNAITHDTDDDDNVFPDHL